MGEFVFFILILIVAIPICVINDTLKMKRPRAELERAAYAVGEVIIQNFLTQPCPRCHESLMILMSVSPNGRSIRYRCQHCGKKAYAAASSPAAASAAPLFESFTAKLESFRRKFDARATADIVFGVPEAPLPYEQTTREPVSEAVRSEVWRRDGGKCVKCGSKENLEFDHIIPVSRGGATSARNLQLLCRSCNRTKSAGI